MAPIASDPELAIGGLEHLDGLLTGPPNLDTNRPTVVVDCCFGGDVPGRHDPQRCF